ncbi:hypothetical protein [Poseidonibacter ostreae]|uniref:Uncharacterized protein n=1 Tax=Poseidonibacter ostreae TaxID=2654171 RepID=A0A6L4WWT1_9BACT|nr:hypothetical protein [Poseidonibacter ostreae]KAB7891327.1 hypothetical protein GBG19_00390 [Poseidonibacter ostreae]
MGAKELFSIALVMILTIGSISYVSGKGDAKILQQKIVQTHQTISTVREWATTFAGISVTKDYTGISMSALNAKGLHTYDVATGGYIKMPFEDTIQVSVSPSTNNKEFVIAISLNTSNNFTDVEKQIFEDKLNADNDSSSTAITGYTTTNADGTISFQFSN